MTRVARHPSRLYIWLAFICGLALIIVTPPLQVPDEVGHFWRAAALSEGDIVPPVGPGGGEGTIHGGYKGFVHVFWRDTAANPEVRFTREQWRLGRQLALRSDIVGKFVRYPSLYSPTLYLPQVATMLFARATNLRPIYTYYLGRIVALLTFVAMFAAAIRIAPVAKYALAVIGLFPMTLTLGGSWSADSMSIALAVLFTALLARAVCGGDVHWTSLTLAGAFLATGKLPYTLLTLGVLLVPADPLRRRAKHLIVFYAAVSLGLLLSFGVQRSGASQSRSDVSPAVQVEALRQHPMRFVEAAATELRSSVWDVVEQSVGRLGLLDVFLPQWTVVACVAAMLGLALAGGGATDPRLRIFLAFVAVAVVVATLLALFLTWTPPGARGIEGFQGRYLLPLLPGLVIAMSLRRPTPAWAAPLVALLAILANAAAARAIIQRFY